MNVVASLAVIASAAFGSGACAGVVKFQNVGEQFDWRCILDGNASQATWLDITQPASQSGAASAVAFAVTRFTGFSTPHFNEDRIAGVTADARIVRRPSAIALMDEEGVVNSFGFARSFAPGKGVGPSLAFHQTAHVAVTNFYTSPFIERTLPTGYVGVSVLLQDGVHYGWIHLEAAENALGLFEEYNVLGWAYETQPGVAIVVPGPGAAGLVGVGLIGWAGRRRCA
ncbi:MAG: hypothetical protein IBJ10_09765 [Phycisphaerales bacterium]|nr:hypothetical protein [Phycisphaerales bacterium]